MYNLSTAPQQWDYELFQDIFGQLLFTALKCGADRLSHTSLGVILHVLVLILHVLVLESPDAQDMQS